MPNLQALTQPKIFDRQLLNDYLEDLADLAPKVEQDVARLRQSPDDKRIVDNLFRILHNIKGDAALCKVEMGVIISHPLETLMGHLRTGKLHFTELLGEIILLTIDRLELAVEALAAGKAITQLQLVKLVQGLEKLSQTPQNQLDTAISGVIESVTGFRPTMATLRGMPQKSAISRSQESIATDLRFFHSLAQQFENRSTHFQGRSARILRLALDTNKAAGKPVNPVQLEAAAYMHDVGMMFLPEGMWLNKLGRLNEDDKKALREHPAYGAGLLERMEDWEPAAEMVAQHHEMPDGAGYPEGLKSDAICPGAKILAIVDAFEAVMLKHTHRGHGRSMLRAIAEVNACDNQFATEWIGPFNSVIRRLIES
ncbi:MAG: HD domain-containing phosphohydrolase [Sulfuricella sp.]|jgi:chemotaxis protein histidine kinase CheA|nr:HD domain-containing phosphohydrolase [Sulfuricella sp.]